MMKNKHPFQLRLVQMALSSVLFMPVAGYAAEADDDSSEEKKITVIGSHIKRQDMEGPSPVISLSAADIEMTGANDLIALFAKLPISGQGTFSTQGNSSDDTANGGASVSLRGLGADSTLILVNGRRISVSPFAKGIDTAFVDINNIPLSAIERVEILKDGASATYGSDAIAGVINIVLKDNFDGLEVSVKTGSTADGGGGENNISLLWGNSNEKSSHTFVMDYFERDEILYADRDYSRSANQAALRPTDPDAIDFRSSSGIPGTIALASDSTVRLADTFGNDVCAPEDIDLANNLCRYDYAPHMSMVPSTRRFSFNYMGKYDLSDSVTAFTELNGQYAHTVTKGAGSPSFNELFMAGDNVNHPLAGDPTHPFFQQDLTMRRRMVDIGNRRKETDTNYYRAIFGLEGDIGEWSWDAAASYIRSHSIERGVDGFPNSLRVQEAIDSGLWNPFEPSANTQAALDFIETTTTRVGKSTNKSVDASFSGPLTEMEHGDLMLAVGLEYREESISDNPDDQFLRGNVFGTEATQANGQRDNTSLFVEVAIPLTEGFDIQLAVRYEDYSDFGTTTNPKVAFRWEATDSLVLRGSFGSAFRAPSLHQLGLGTTQESPSLVDDIRCDAVGNINKACEPQEYTVIFEGNPNLEPEESDSYNLGAIYEISENFSFSIDYYDYQIEDIIVSDTQFALSNFGTDPNIVLRLPSALPNDPGEIVEIYDIFRNVGDLNLSGLDFDIRYNLETDVGEFKFSYVLNYVLEYEDLRRGLNNTVRVNAVEGDFEQPEIRWTLTSSWAKDDLGASLAVNFIDEFKGDASVGFGDKVVDAMTTVDGTFSYNGFEDATLTIGVNNLFNEEPPFSHHDFMGFVTNIHSGQGRFTYAKATYRF